MGTERHGHLSDEIGVVESGRKGGAAAAIYSRPVRPVRRALSADEAGEMAYLGLSRVTWPAIWAGFFIGIAAYIVLNTLGLALGMTWVTNDQIAQGTIQTAAGIWLIMTTLVSFFVGGCVTARMGAMPGRATGAMNGLLYACFSFIFLSVLVATPGMNAIPSLVSLFSGLNGGTNMGPGAMPNVSPNSAQGVAWWTFVGLVIALGAGALGGMCGARPAAVDPLTPAGEDDAGS